MRYKEITGDLFKEGQGCILVQCISADFVMGAGIAVKFREMGIKDALKGAYPNEVNEWNGGECITTHVGGATVCNLITKRNVYDKPTYEDLQKSLYDMKSYIEQSCEFCKTVKVAMPLIGCGIDGLEWEKVSRMVQDTFDDISNLEITVVKWEKEKTHGFSREGKNWGKYDRD